jgi:hypothetical protein
MNLYDWLLLLAAKAPITSLWRTCVRNNISYCYAHKVVLRAQSAKHLLVEQDRSAQGKPLIFSITPLGKEYLHSKYSERIAL